MQSIELYKFEEKVRESGSKYIYQYVKGRPLTTIPHSHDFYEICYVICGNCMEKHNGHDLLIVENTLSILPPGSSHYFTNQSDNLILVCLSVEKDEFKKFASVISPEIIDYIYSTSDKNIFNVFSTSSVALYKNPYLNIQNDLDYKQLLSFFMVNISKNQLLSSNSIPSKFENSINRLPANEIILNGVPALTELSNYSRTQLTRLMKKHFGKTPQEYVTDLRMNYAYNRLTLTNIRIEDIAERCGYESFSHFCQVFKGYFGDTPSSIRKKHLTHTI